MYKARADELFRFENITSRPKNQVLSILNGGPGTGKTFVVSLIIRYYEYLNQKSVLRIVKPVLPTVPTAAAAILYPGGSTLHTQFGFYAIPTSHKLKFKKSMDNSIISQNLTAMLLIIDEAWMATEDFFKKGNARFQNLRKNGLPFGGIDIILIGDPSQMGPGVGRSILHCFFEETEMGDFFRSFKRYNLHTQNRALGDPFQQAFINKLRNYKEHPFPISEDMFVPTCQHCQLLRRPTKECEHFHVLTKEDVQEDAKWSVAPMVSFTHQSIDNLLFFKLKTFAILKNTIILRWRYPSITIKGQVFDVGHLTDVQAEKYPRLWGYFVRDLPVTVNYNINIPGRLVHGTKAVLKSIRPGVSSPETFNNLLNMYYNNPPGTMITIDCSLGVFLQCEDTDPALQTIFLLANDVNNDRRHTTVKITNIFATQMIIIKVVNSGYDCSLLTTIFGIQGQNCPLLIIDINKYFGYHTSIHHFITCVTRISSFLDMRIMPWNKEGYGHLLKLKLPDIYIHWDDSYSIDGVFDANKHMDFYKLQ